MMETSAGVGNNRVVKKKSNRTSKRLSQAPDNQ